MIFSDDVFFKIIEAVGSQQPLNYVHDGNDIALSAEIVE